MMTKMVGDDDADVIASVADISMSLFSQITNTVQPLLLATYIKQPPDGAFYGQYNVIPNVHFYAKLTTVQQRFWYILRRALDCLRQICIYALQRK